MIFHLAYSLLEYCHTSVVINRDIQWGRVHNCILLTIAVQGCYDFQLENANILEYKIFISWLTYYNLIIVTLLHVFIK